MENSFLSIEVEGKIPLQNLFNRLPQEAKDAAVESIAEHLYGVVKEEPPQKSITRKQAYGVTFFSDKQRRWFFAALKSGSINVPYRRTGTFSQGWRIVGTGDNTRITNNTGYGEYLMGEKQSRMSALIGWKKLSDVVPGTRANIEALTRAGIKAIETVLNRLI